MNLNLIKELCPICKKELENYSIIQNFEKREIKIYGDCPKCNREFRSKYKITFESIEEIKEV